MFQCGTLAIGKIESLVEAAYPENVPGGHGNIAENKLTTTLRKQIAQAQEIGYACRIEYFDREKIKYHVTTTTVNNPFVDFFKLITYLRLFRQTDKNNIFH